MSEIRYPQVAVPSIMDISVYVGGKSKVEGNKNPIKLSSNENSFGASPATLAAMQNAIEKQHRYPDGGARLLRQAIADKYSISADQIVCGAGSDELIFLLCDAFAGHGDEVLYSEYGFLMYPISAKAVGATPVVASETNKRTDIDALIAAVNDNTKIIFIANPNNPTGSYITRAEIEKLLAAISPEIVVVIDAAYAEYVEASDYSSGLELVNNYTNVVMTRTFSKIYGLGGLRLGWCYGSPYISDVLNRIRGPFNVSAMAQDAGVAAMNDVEFEDFSRNHNRLWLKEFTSRCQSFGFTVYPSVANFILIECDTAERAEKFNTFMAECGIIVRDVVSYGLPSCIRVTIGTEEENKAFLTAVEQFSAM